MKDRYFLFSFSEYYPSGGLSDVRKMFDSVDEANKHIDICLSGESEYYLSEYWYLWDRLEDKIIRDSK